MKRTTPDLAGSSVPKLVGAVALAALLVAAASVPASAHDGSTPQLSCSTLATQLSNFPKNKPLTVTPIVTVAAVTSTLAAVIVPVDAQGHAAVSVDITALTNALHGAAGSVSGRFTWTTDGGGQTPTASAVLTCGELPPPGVSAAAVGPMCAARLVNGAAASVVIRPKTIDPGSITVTDPTGQWTVKPITAAPHAWRVHLRAASIPTAPTTLAVHTDLGDVNVSLGGFDGRNRCALA